MSIYDKLGISEEVAEFFAIREKNAILEERCAQLEERLRDVRHATTQQVNVPFQGMEMAEKLTRPAESPAQTIATALQAAFQILEVWSRNQKPSAAAAPKADFWVSISEFAAIFARAQGRADLAQELRSRVEEFKLTYNSVQEVLEACQTLWPLVVGEEREPEDVEGDPLGEMCRKYAEKQGREDLAEALHSTVFSMLPAEVIVGPMCEYPEFVSPKIMSAAWEETLADEARERKSNNAQDKDFILSRFAREYAESHGKADLAEYLERELEKLLPIWSYYYHGANEESRKKREELTSDAWAYVVNQRGGQS